MSFPLKLCCALLLAYGSPLLAEVVVPPSGGDLDDAPAPLATPRDELEQDHLQALSLFAAARTHQQREEFPQAMKLYARAARLDPRSPAPLRDLVPLAFQANRPDTALRYALKLIELDPKEQTITRRLASYLADTGDYKGAARLYELCLARLPKTNDAARATASAELGRVYFQLDDLPQAAKNFAVAIAALKDPAASKLDKATIKSLTEPPQIGFDMPLVAFLAAGQLPQAEATLELMKQSKVDPAFMALATARVELGRRRATAALAALEQYFAKPPKEVPANAYKLLAEILQELGRSAEFIARLEKLAEKEPDRETLQTALVEAYLAADKLDAARQLLERLEKKRATVETVRSLIDVSVRQKDPVAILDALGRWSAVGGTLDMLPEPLRKQLLGPTLLASVLAHADRLAAAPKRDDFDRLQAAALLAAAAKNQPQLDKFSEAAITARPDQTNIVLLQWGMELVTDQRYANAAKVFERGVARLPEDDAAKAAFQYYQAIALEMSGQTDAALAAARAAASKKAADPRFASRVAWILMHAKQNAAAITAYKSLLAKFDADHSDANPRELMRDARQALSTLEVDAGQMPAAVEWLEQILDEFPDDPGANNDLAYLWAEQGQHLRRALQMAKLAVAAEPTNLAYADTLGWVYYKLGRYQEAEKELRRAVDPQDPDGVALDHLGDCLAKLGRTDEAQATWRRAVAALEKSSDAKRRAAVAAKLKPAAAKP